MAGSVDALENAGSNAAFIVGTLTVDSGLGAGTATIQEYLALTRYVVSYEDYWANGAFFCPDLGAWWRGGVNNQAWAVIDDEPLFLT